jgi:hypothetical protein
MLAMVLLAGACAGQVAVDETAVDGGARHSPDGPALAPGNGTMSDGLGGPSKAGTPKPVEAAPGPSAPDAGRGLDAGQPVDLAGRSGPADGGIPPSSVPAMAKQQADIDKAFDLRVLHKIEVIVQGQANIDRLGEKEDERVPVTVIFDGVRVEMVGARQSGGTFNPAKKLLDKPSLNLKFNAFVPGRDIHGVKRFTLKNMLQDMSLLNEHLAYEVFRRAGIAAPTTAWALVTIKAAGTSTQGEATGLYLMREAVNADFFVRTIGKGYEQGNLYETDWTFDDFAASEENARRLELKDEREEMRTRADILKLSAAIRSSTPTTFLDAVAPLFDIDRYVTYHAVETVVSAYDGFSFNNNNSFLYNNPKDGKFLIVPWGADQAFWCPQPGQTANYIDGPGQNAESLTSEKMRAVPALNMKYQAEIRRIASPPVWDVDWFKARIAHASALFATAPKISHVVKDLANHERYKPELLRFIENGGASRSTAKLPRLSASR